jgi:hypothetical protein
VDEDRLISAEHTVHSIRYSLDTAENKVLQNKVEAVSPVPGKVPNNSMGVNFDPEVEENDHCADAVPGQV